MVSASSKVIIFDLHTGEVFRTINPGVEGIVSNLSISPNDKYCICSTTFHQVIICNLRTGDFQLIEQPVEEGQILGKPLHPAHCKRSMLLAVITFNDAKVVNS